MNILLIGSRYASSQSANGICSQHLGEEMLRQGHGVFVISTGEEDRLKPEDKSGVKVWTIKNEWFNQLLPKLQRGHKWYHTLLKPPYWLLRSLYILPRYPITQHIRLNRSYKLAKAIIEKENIDIVLCTCLPYEPIAVGIKLKEKYGNKVRVVTYHLDILSYPNNKDRLLKAFKERSIKKAIERELNVVDKMLVPESGIGLFSSSKIEYTGFPAYINHNGVISAPYKFDSQYINIVFVGSLDKSNRSPKYAISLLEKISKEKGLPLHISVWGNVGDSETKKLLGDGPIVEYRGMLENKYVNDILSKSDVLLNISNAVLYNLIPSKIFLLFDSNKPIINIVNHPDDMSLQYFEGTDGVINIKTYEEWNKEDICEFLSSSRRMKIKRERIKQYSAEFICQQILEI